VVTVRSWFTLFFIPIIPYRVRHMMMCTTCGGNVELDAERMAQAKHVIESGGVSIASVGTSYDAQLAAYEEQLAAERERGAAARRRAAGTETDADRLRARMEQRNPNWDDRRS
jgi:hypothetical protein